MVVRRHVVVDQEQRFEKNDGVETDSVRRLSSTPMAGRARELRERGQLLGERPVGVGVAQVRCSASVVRKIPPDDAAYTSVALAKAPGGRF
jgi:hypothetical protein